MVTTRIKGLNMAYFKLEVGRISNAFCFAVIMPIICTHVQLKHMKENTNTNTQLIELGACIYRSTGMIYVYVEVRMQLCVHVWVYFCFVTSNLQFTIVSCHFSVNILF